MSDACASEYRPSMYRWQVMDAYDKATGNLARCLAVAGALCAAWYQGHRYAIQRYLMSGFKIDGFDWTPGCGREAMS